MFGRRTRVQPMRGILGSGDWRKAQFGAKVLSQLRLQGGYTERQLGMGRISSTPFPGVLHGFPCPPRPLYRSLPPPRGVLALSYPMHRRRMVAFDVSSNERGCEAHSVKLSKRDNDDCPRVVWPEVQDISSYKG